MTLKSKIIYIIGSVIIGIISLIGIYVSLIATGAIDTQETKLVFSSSSAESVYNGEELTSSEWSIVSGELGVGEKAVVVVTGTQTNAGTSQNTFTVKILDLNNTDVSSLYSIEYQVGTLTVKPKDLQLTSKEATKVYDGVELTCDEYEITGGSLIDGHTLDCTVTGKRTLAGEVDNLMTAIVNDENEKDVTFNYDIEYIYGKLKVEKRPLVLSSESATKIFDGTPLSKEGYSIVSGTLADNQEITASDFAVRTEVGEQDNDFKTKISIVAAAGEEEVEVTACYQITFNYGKLVITPSEIVVSTGSATKVYDGTPLTSDVWTIVSGETLEGHTLNVVPDGTITNAGQISNTAKFTVTSSSGENFTSNYVVKLEAGTLTVTKLPITIKTDSAEKVFDGIPLSAPNGTITSGALLEGHSFDATFAELNEVGVCDNEFEPIITDAQNNDVTTCYEITKDYGKLTVKSVGLRVITEDKTKVYDGTPLTCTEYILEGELVEGHSIDVDIIGSITNIGQTVVELDHVIYNAVGENVTKDYTVTYEKASLQVTPVFITITTNSNTKVYDATPLTDSGYYYGGNIVSGQTLEVVVEGSITDVGSAKNSFTVNVYDGTTNVSGNYVFTKKEGDLVVTKRSLTITSSGASKHYDGTPLETSDDAYSVLGTLASGQTLTVDITGSRTEVGDSENTFDYSIADTATSNPILLSNYDVTVKYGKLNVYDSNIEITSRTVSKTYDGTELTAGYDVNGSVATGHTLYVFMSGSQTNAGQSNNAFTYEIRDDLTGTLVLGYNVTTVEGLLTVNKRPITILTGSEEKTFDGSALQKTDGVLITSGELVAGHQLVTTGFASITKVGIAPNTCIASILNESNLSVSANYDIIVNTGELEITPVDLTITASSIRVEYDGAIHTSSTFSVSRTDLLSTYSILATVSGSIREPGVVPNVVNGATVSLKTNGEDYTNCFNFTYVNGTLVVFNRSMTVSANGNSKPFDGTALTSNGYTISNGSLASGQTISVSISGSQTAIGESSCVISGYSIKDSNGYDVTRCYDIITVDGKLVVSDPSSLGSSAGLSNSMTDDDDSSVVLCYKIYADTSGNIYLRACSYGEYIIGNSTTSASWGSGTVYSSTANGYSANYLTGMSLLNSGVNVSYAKLLAVNSSIYVLPYYLADDSGNYDRQLSDVAYVGDNSAEYTIGYYSADLNTLTQYTPNISSLTSYELAYYNFVKNNYLSVPASTKAYLQNIVDSENFDASDEYIIQKVASYIQNAASYNSEYDRTIDYGDSVVNFLNSGEGVCRHYAASATLLFRTLGIPARYTGGFLANSRAGVWSDVSSSDAHAWVEVYIAGLGWVQVEVTGSQNSESSKTKLTIRPSDCEMEYNGYSILRPTNELLGLSNLISQGYTYQAKVSGSRLTVGTSLSTITSFNLYNNLGDDVTSLYDITYNQGKINVYLYTLTVTTKSFEKEYDGNPFASSSLAYEYEGLATGHRIYSATLNETALISDYGSYENIYDFVIYNELDEDVSDMYKISGNWGTLYINMKPITIVSDSATKIYDGTPLTCSTYTIKYQNQIIDESVLFTKGETIIVTITGTITQIGGTTNTIQSVLIKDALGNDITDNYAINLTKGRLQVTGS